jgi:DNA-binding transcriptional MocR family regulator
MAAAAERQGIPLIIDETMADLWLEAPRPSPMAAFGDARQLISLGSTGKSYWGGLRIGWIRADPQAVAALAAVRAAFDLGSPVLEQLAAAVLLSEEDDALAARREMLRRRRDHLRALIVDRFPEWRVNRPNGGLSLWAELPRPVSSLLAVAADSEGLRIGAGPRFGLAGAFERFLRLPYALPEDGLTDAVSRLARAWDSLGRGPVRRAPVEQRQPELV